MKYCPNCGSEVDASDGYCHECGGELTERGTESSETGESEKVSEGEPEVEEENEKVQDKDSGNLTDIKAVGETKAEALRDAGYETVDDLREATQEEIAEVENIGKALSARIKSNVDREELEEEDNRGTEVNPWSVFVLIAIVVVLGITLLAFGSNLETGPSPDSPDSPDAQGTGTTDESTGDNDEPEGTDSSNTETGGSEDAGQSSSGDTEIDESGNNNQDSVPQYGETLTLSNGVEVTVENPEKIDSFSANGITQTPEEGNIFVQVFVTARNPTDEEKSLPSRYYFSLIFRNRQYDTASFAQLKDDVYEGGFVQPNIVRDGSIVFETTEEADLSEIQIVWSNNLDESARWSES